MAVAVDTRLRRWLSEVTAKDLAAPDRETLTSEGGATPDDSVKALHVLGANGATRHLLPIGIVALGRSAESTVVVDDSRVSREHAALQVGDDVFLSDLGSANGTFVDGDRLRPGEARNLVAGQTFFIGDSALAVWPTSLPRRCPGRVSTLDEVRERFRAVAAASDASTRMIAFHVRLAPPMKGNERFLESILSPTLVSPRDWLMWSNADSILLGVETASDADAAHLDRAMLQHALSWGVTIDVRWRAVTCQEALRAGEDLRTLLCGAAPLLLRRGDVVVRDPAMEALRRTIERIASSSVNVLVLGETGAGKDVVVSMLHELSSRAAKPLMGINCASLPETLLESELFGHEKGAFTGAIAAKAGLLEAAAGGTVFLDEIGELSLGLQAKLLRVIESKEVTRLGSVRARTVDVRFVAATNRDLADASATSFRRDLFYRLNGVTLTVPPLRARPTEIEPLARMFLKGACARFGILPRGFSPATIAVLTAYQWPGNVRELRSAVERAVLLAPGDIIEPDHLGLPQADLASVSPVDMGSLPTTSIASSSIEADLDRERIPRALAACGGNQTRAARFLGISRRTLVRRIAELGLPRPHQAKG